jgi:hypothetical protein
MFSHLKHSRASLPINGHRRGPARGSNVARERLPKPPTIAADSQTIEWVITEGPHRHVVSVGIGILGAPSREMSVAEVIDALKAGQSFATHRPGMPTSLPVEKASCRFFNCTAETIRSYPDEMTDNNLDVLPDCG